MPNENIHFEPSPATLAIAVTGVAKLIGYEGSVVRMSIGAVEHIETLGTEAGAEIDKVVVASITC